jgi:integrase
MFGKVLQHLPPDHQDFATFLFISGWRRSEASGLRWSDIAGNIIRLPGQRTKTGKARILPIGPQLKALIERRRVRGRESVFVFTYVAEKRSKGQTLPIRDFRKRWKRATAAAGAPGALIHDLRRTSIRNARRAGLSESEAMLRSGHKTSAVFKRYDIISEADALEAAERFEASLPVKSA